MPLCCADLVSVSNSNRVLQVPNALIIEVGYVGVYTQLGGKRLKPSAEFIGVSRLMPKRGYHPHQRRGLGCPTSTVGYAKAHY